MLILVQTVVALGFIAFLFVVHIFTATKSEPTSTNDAVEIHLEQSQKYMRVYSKEQNLVRKLVYLIIAMSKLDSLSVLCSTEELERKYGMDILSTVEEMKLEREKLLEKLKSTTIKVSPGFVF